MAPGVERRVSVRHETVDKRTRVEIMDRTGHRTRRARLVNFSASGALIVTDQLPALNQPLRVRIQLAKEIGWFSAIPVRLGGSNQVGIRFVGPFPLRFPANCMPDDDPTVVEEIDD
jgi:hypothetical protein